MRELPFDFEVAASVFEKSDAGAGKQRRIGGLISTESRDQHKETLLQRGLDFTPFSKAGWYNDNHDKKTGGIIGYPEVVKSYAAGERLPNGRLAKTAGTWAEWYLLNTPRATEVWDLGKALQETDRSLGFSVQGSVHRRAGADLKTVTKATVREVAITGCPVNAEAQLEILAKSLEAVDAADKDEENEVAKALTVGTQGASPAGPKTGAWLQAKRPGVDLGAACRIVEITKNLKRQDRL